MIAAREFTSTAEMQANAALVHQRCFQPKVRPVARLLPAPTTAPKPQHVAYSQLPEWKRLDIHFDAHVLASVRIIEMIKNGEIEITQIERRTVQQIVLEVLERFPGVTVAQVRGAARCRNICRPRMEAIYAVRQERMDMSTPAIGRWFGGRDHSTILHSLRKIDAEKA